MKICLKNIIFIILMQYETYNHKYDCKNKKNGVPKAHRKTGVNMEICILIIQFEIVVYQN